MTDGLTIVGRGLKKSFEAGTVRALDGIDLDIAAGERVAVTGPTGCGKSTLLSIIALLESADAGELSLGGVETPTIGSPERWRAHHLGIVFQLHHLLPHLTAEENVMLPLFGAVMSTAEIRARARRMLESIGLGHRAGFTVSKLSGGERQLTAVARALVTEPQLLLADEPTGSVDSRTGERVLELILGDRLPGGPTVVLVTHDLGIARQTDRTIAMLDGRVRS